MRRIIIFLYITTCTIMAGAQNEKLSNRNRVTIEGGVTSQYTWQVDVAYHYMLSPYVGIGTSVGMWKQFSKGGFPEGEGWKITPEYAEASNLYLRPSLHFVTPTLINISDGKLKLFLEPGFMINVPYCEVSFI